MSSLYRKYRPSTFSEVIGQTHIVRTLSNAIKNERIGHAYLFTGPRGTGKTTLARIFAKTINCLQPSTAAQENLSSPSTSIIQGIRPFQEPCNQCTNCQLISTNRAMDLIEIDAASNTGVDNMRQLKETVTLPPTALKYKVYIIDEVHMLSIGAFNALLKTLEEPPAHAIFILATTELHKVPETIISRCQRFDFSRLNQDQIIQRLKQLADLEQVEIDQESLETIALEAEGGMRDAESLLGQIIALEDKKITAVEVNQILGTSSKLLALDFLDLLAEPKTQEALEKINQIQADGLNLKNFTKNLLAYLRNLLILSTSPQSTNLVSTLTGEQIKRAQALVAQIPLVDLLQLTDLFQKSLASFKTAPIPQLPLELAVIEYHVAKGSAMQSTVPGGNSNFGPTPLPTPPMAQPKYSTKPTQPVVNQIQPQSPPAASLSAQLSNIAASVNQSAPGQPAFRSSMVVPATAIQENSPVHSTAEISPTMPPTLVDEPPVSVATSEISSENIAASTEQPAQTNVNLNIELILNKWSEILAGIKPINHSIHAFLKNCIPAGMIDGKLYIKTKYDFYKDKLNEPANRLTVSQVIAKIVQGDLKVTFATEDDCQHLDFSQTPSSTEDRNILHDAMQVFGGKIVES